MNTWWCMFVLFCAILNIVFTQSASDSKAATLTTWAKPRTFGLIPSSWSLQNKIPMTEEYDDYARKGKHKIHKKIKRLILPLLIAYKLKFFTLIPIIVGGLLLLVASTGLAGFFFALFAASMGLKTSSH